MMPDEAGGTNTDLKRGQQIYTRRGDLGQTSLLGGSRIEKNSPRIAAYGTVDELGSFVAAAFCSASALARTQGNFRRLAAALRRVQHELFVLGAILATLPGKERRSHLAIDRNQIKRLEQEIDSFSRDLAPLRAFILAGGTRLSIELHQCRTICRRAERLSVGLYRNEEISAEPICYLNRLSDALFTWGRWADAAQGSPDVLFDPGALSQDEGEEDEY